MSKKVQAVSDATPIQSDDVMMPDDIANLCSMIITNVTDGKVTKTGLITSKEKLEKLMKLSDVTVKDGEFEAMKIRGHEVIAIVSTERVVTFHKVEANNEETNPNNNKENMGMENKEEVKNENVETKNNNAAPAAEAAPVAELLVPTDSLDDDARADLRKTVSEKIKAGEVNVVAHTRVVSNKQLAKEAAWTVGSIFAGFLVCLGLSALFSRD